MIDLPQCRCNMRSLFVFIICICAFPLYAQHSLKGSLTDESNVPLQGATIRVLSADSTLVGGTITDNKGHFQIQSVNSGEYIMAISNVGYINLYINFEMPNSDYNLPPTILKLDNVLLEGITIVGSSYIQKKDHLLVVPNKEQIKHAFSGYDLLYNLMIPGLTINRKNKTVTSMTGDATLYINGVEAEMREIQNLQPKDIERIEYYVLPVSGKFTGDAASVNYITKVHKTGGYITIDGLQNIGYLRGDYNIGAKIAHNNTNYSLWAGHSMKSYDGLKNEKEEIISFPDYAINRNTANSGAAFRNNQQYAQFKVNNDTKKRSLSASISAVRDETPHNDQREILDYTGYDPHNIVSTDNNNSKSMRSSINLNGNFYLNSKHQLKIRLNGGYTKNDYNRSYTEGSLLSVSDVSEDLYSFDGQIAHLFQPNSSNSLYSRVTQFHNVTSSHYSGEYASWQHLWKGETLFQFDYTHQFSKKLIMMLSPGASWLNYKLHGNNLVSSWNIRVNSWLRYIPDSKQWAAVGFALGNNQPDISYLNTASQTVDSYQIKRGNPYLDNTTLCHFLLMYAGQLHPLFSLQGKAMYTINKNNVSSSYFFEGDKLISSYESDKSFNTANVELSISSRISENLQTKIGLKYGYMYVPGRSDLSQSNLSASFDVNYFIKSFSLNFYASTTEKMLDERTFIFRKLPASYGLSVRYSRKNWMAEAGTENPFTKKSHYREYADYGIYRYNQVQTSRIYQQTAYIKLAYSFDFGKKTTRDSNNVDRTINSAILKAR